MKAKHEEKLKQYIKEDRPRRLKSFVRKHKLKLSVVCLKHNRNLVHYCCKYGSGTILRYLLSEGLNATLQDNDLKCPLHLALLRALKHESLQESDISSQCYHELILPLLERYPECLDLTDNTGQTCRQLLQQLVKQRETTSYSFKTSEESSPEPGDLTEQEWRDKLADEHQHEYSTTWGHYEQDLTWDLRDEETYDDWAERIRQEYKAKKRAQERAYCYKNNKPTADSKDTGSKIGGSRNNEKYHKETLEEARERMREQFDKRTARDQTVEVLKTRMKYEERYKLCLENKDKQTLTFDDVPWPSVKSERSDINVLFDLMDKDSSEYKKYLRDQQIRWHPDKFLQRFGGKLSASEKEKIMKRVTLLSQDLNKLKT